MLKAEIFLPTEYNLLCVCISNVALHSNVLFLVSRKSCMKLDGAFRPFGQLEIVTRINRMARELTWKEKRKNGFLKYLEGLKRYYDKDLCKNKVETNRKE